MTSRNALGPLNAFPGFVLEGSLGPGLGPSSGCYHRLGEDGEAFVIERAMGICLLQRLWEREYRSRLPLAVVWNERAC